MIKTVDLLSYKYSPKLSIVHLRYKVNPECVCVCVLCDGEERRERVIENKIH